MGTHHKRHCWECRRRLLVCDSADPACKRCIRSGVTCPGYGDVKPMRVRFVEPGRVTTRRPRQKKILHNNEDEEIAITRSSHDVYGSSNSWTSENDLVSIISRFDMTSDAFALPQAAEYYNGCIYVDIAAALSMVPTPHVYPVTSEIVQTALKSAPDYLQLSNICMALGHRINRLGKTPDTAILAKKFYEYWGLSAKCLSRQLQVEETQKSDVVIAGMLMLLLTDIQQGTSLNWRCHLDGIYKVMALRGGFGAVCRSKAAEPILGTLLLIASLGNTTCPASQVDMTGYHLEALDLLVDNYYETPFPPHECPLVLFSSTLEINHLRSRIVNAKGESVNGENFEMEAQNILRRIEAFSPQEWAETRPNPSSDWELLGDIFRTSTVMYCILSLQSLHVLPTTSYFRRRCSAHGRHLRELLGKALQLQHLKWFMLWPLVVLGAEAVHDSQEMQNFVTDWLPNLSSHTGTYVPLTVKQVLEIFWASGETDWDVCFDRPYAFTMQIAVASGHLY